MLELKKGYRKKEAKYTRGSNFLYVNNDKGFIGRPTLRFYDENDLDKINVYYNTPTQRIHLKLDKDKTIYLEPKFVKIVEVIEESKELLDRKDNWDGDDALSCNPEIYYRAINELIKYSQYLYNYSGIIISPPEISLAKDGSIDIEWFKESEYVLLYSILNTKEIDNHFYFKDYKEGSIAKGIINKDSINSILSFCMKNFK